MTETLFATGPNRRRLILLAILSLTFVAIGIWMIGKDGDGTPRRGMGLSAGFWGWFIVLFFGACSAIYLRVLVWPFTSVQATRHGVVLRWLAGRSYGPLHWAEIDRIAAAPRGRVKSLQFVLANPLQTQRRLGPRSTLFGRANLKASLELPGFILDTDAETTASRLNALRRQFVDD